MVLGLYTSTVFWEQIICSIPNQSASRIIVPRFPGSWISSSARQRDWRAKSGLNVYCGCSKTASTCCGVFSRLARDSSSWETSSISFAWMSGCACNHEEVAARKRQGKCPSKSPVNLGPSARNSCSSLRVSLVPVNGYTLFYFCLALFFYFFIYRKAINIFLINRLLNKFFENNSFSY